MRAYAIQLTVPRRLWMTTTGGEQVRERAGKRHELRVLGRRAWREAKRQGARPVDRYMMWVTVGNRRESPVLSAETLKPLIDAGTDMGLWPDDDPWHRACTCYLTDPRAFMDSNAHIGIWVLPLAAGEDPKRWLLSHAPDARGGLVTVRIPDGEWLTSNMRMSVEQRKRRQSMIMRRAEPAWRDLALGGDCAVICGVRYPDPRPEWVGDPDNTAEAATAVWGAGALNNLVPATPSMFAFTLLPGSSGAGMHDLSLLAFTVPHGFSWIRLLADA